MTATKAISAATYSASCGGKATSTRCSASAASKAASASSHRC